MRRQRLSFPYACEVSCRVRAGLARPPRTDGAEGFTPRTFAGVTGCARFLSEGGSPAPALATTRREHRTVGRTRRSGPVLFRRFGTYRVLLRTSKQEVHNYATSC